MKSPRCWLETVVIAFTDAWVSRRLQVVSSSEPSAELLSGERSGTAWARPGAAAAAERIMAPPAAVSVVPEAEEAADDGSPLLDYTI